MLRRSVYLLAACVAVVLAAPAAAEEAGSDRPSGDGGLHVSGGATFGYIGGSGSPSGTIRGPGGSGAGGNVAPAPAEPETPPQPEPAAEVEPAAPPAEDAEEASSGARMGPLSWVVAALMTAGGFWLYRKLPAPR